MKDGNNNKDVPENRSDEKSDWLKNNSEVSWDYYREEKDDSGEPPLGSVPNKEGFWCKRMKPFLTSKKGITILSVVLAVLIALGCAGWWVVSHYLNKIDTGDQYTATNNDGTDILEDMNFPTINEVPASELDGTLKDMILKNYMNGKPISSKNVINVLLIGRDTLNENEDSRSDAMILVSLNKATKKITMVSLFRDQYCYIPNSNGGSFSKLNSAHSWGGPELLIKTIEGNLKVVIDNYASVNFSTFPKIIDALGGVDLEITQREASYMKSRFNLDIASGKVHANGQQALAYSRIRYIDSDVVRNERQRTVLIALFNELKNASAKEMKNVLDAALPYVKTGFSKSDLLSLGTQALTKGWTNYEILQYTCPKNENYYTSGYIGDQWFWILDYPAVAQELQTELYGKSNIVLATDRPNFKTLTRGKASSTGSSSGGGSSSGNHSSSSSGTTKAAETTTRQSVTKPDWWPVTTEPGVSEETETHAETTTHSTSKENENADANLAE